MKSKGVMVPFSACIPDVAYARIRQEAQRRKVRMEKVINDLLILNPLPPRYSFPDLGPIDWDDEAQVNGVIVGEYAMQYLPPSRREVQ